MRATSRAGPPDIHPSAPKFCGISWVALGSTTAPPQDVYTLLYQWNSREKDAPRSVEATSAAGVVAAMRKRQNIDRMKSAMPLGRQILHNPTARRIMANFPTSRLGKGAACESGYTQSGAGQVTCIMMMTMLVLVVMVVMVTVMMVMMVMVSATRSSAEGRELGAGARSQERGLSGMPPRNGRSGLGVWRQMEPPTGSGPLASVSSRRLA